MGEFINVLVSKGKSNLIPEKDNLYGQFVGEWDFGVSGFSWLVSFLLSV